MPVGLFFGNFLQVRASHAVAIPNDFASAQGQCTFEPVLGFDAGPTAVAVVEVALEHAEDRHIGLGAGGQGAQLRPADSASRGDGGTVYHLLK